MRPLLLVVVVTVAVLAGACGDAPPADGTRENPFTELDPGPHADVAAVHQPIIWGARTGRSLVRLWLEVLDAQSGVRHPQAEDHFIRQISATTDNGDSLFERAFLSTSQARAVGEVSFAAAATQVDVRVECTQHGWWRRLYEVADLDVAPNGELTRAYSAAVPGDDPTLAPTHVPRLVARDGELTVEVGDRSTDALHETTPEHYVDRLMILNQDAQTLVDVALGPDGGEPARIVGFSPGTGAVRVYAACNLHGWWEAVFIVPE